MFFIFDGLHNYYYGFSSFWCFLFATLFIQFRLLFCIFLGLYIMLFLTAFHFRFVHFTTFSPFCLSFKILVLVNIISFSSHHIHSCWEAHWYFFLSRYFIFLLFIVITHPLFTFLYYIYYKHSIMILIIRITNIVFNTDIHFVP